MNKRFGSLTLEVQDSGIGQVIFSRPPVNAMSLSVYADIGALVDAIEKDETVRVIVLSAPEESRAWCGGADLNDFVGIDGERRKERYRFINAHLPRFYELSLPTIAAINGPAIGIGMVLAGLCDMRVAAEDAIFACPEIDYGLVGGGAGLFGMLKIPESKIREILFTGRKFTARELEPTGFCNYVVTRSEVLPKAMAIAELIASKSRPSIRARKTAFVAQEGKGWMDSYLDAQGLSAVLVASEDSNEGVRAFLDHRKAVVRDE